MVKTRSYNDWAIQNKELTTKLIDKFGHTLTHRKLVEVFNSQGQLQSATLTDVDFKGDLQLSPNIDQKYISSGVVEVGDAVLYIHPDALTTIPVPQDEIVDGNSIWEVINILESPDLGGTICHYAFRCKRQINSSD